MHYPFWYVPSLTSPMLIAIVGILHMFAAMYAVGGAILLALLLRRAYRTRNEDYTEYLRQHAWFFVLITVVFGAISGLGIWWTIGLTSPLATEDLIHIFVFVWSLEYVAFIVEVVSAFIFFYYWGRLDRKTHLAAVWIYAGAAWISLLLITPITAFQVNNGGWKQGDGVWAAFWNPQAIPQIVARTGAALLLAALYVLLHASIKLRNKERLRSLIGSETAKLSVYGVALTIVGGGLWMATLPASGQASLVGAATLNILVAIIFALSVAVAVLMYFGPYRNPGWVTLGLALVLTGMGLAATATGEFIREATRKPYIVYGRVLGNQIRPQEIPRLKSTGYLNGGVWTRAYLKDKFPQVMTGERVDAAKFSSLSPKDRLVMGRTVFNYHCNDCHGISGYSPVSQLTRGWTKDMLKEMVNHLPQNHFFMPPWSGTDQEADVLVDYLYSVRLPFPGGMMYPRVQGGGR